jgi:zinc D-Ala-D-Ala carboxypeptidase
VGSGYRSYEVNKAVGGTSNSQHRLGEAADIVPVKVPIITVFDWIVKTSNINYGQVIYEIDKHKEWIHISLPRFGGKNNEALIYKDGITKTYNGGLT